MSGKIYGYVRVSTKDFNRPAYQSLPQKLKPNDTVVFKSIDRLGKNFYK